MTTPDTFKDTVAFIDATVICSNAGKKWHKFIMNARIQEFMKELAKSLGVEKTSLWKSTPGRNGRTLVHPAVHTRLVLWISESFHVPVTMWLERTKINDKVIAEEHREAIEKLKPTFSHQYEAEVRERLANEVNGQQCVIGKFGEIDIVTTTEVIEIKWIKKWAHALGQVLAHVKSMPERSPRVHFFGFDEDYTPGILDHIKLLYDDYNITVTHEVVADE
jgi:hypothetical protein